ncbi:MAG: Rrf2 family transcriptional regulator [Deltaproteobacteria bacterium]|jgi:Rrf2 family protein|nr:Rrf2 family transcriptional regulator [Deltaproteobacteria bacterium]
MGLMQIPRRVEYALRAMIDLADRPDKIARASEIARRQRIPKYFLDKVVRDLMSSGLVRARRGPGGGYQLARPPRQVTFRDIIEAVEGPVRLNLCVEGAAGCSLQPTCRMFKVWAEGQRLLLSVFSRATLGDIVGSAMDPAAVSAPSDLSLPALSAIFSPGSSSPGSPG